MNRGIILVAVVVLIAVVQSAPPVFLDDYGASICTLNNVGSIPKGAVTYPVYQKVCRNVYPGLGDQLNDDEKRKSNKSPTNIEQKVEKIRRAILGVAQDSN